MSLIIEMLQESCHKQKDKAALRHKTSGQWTMLSYTQLWEESGQVAAALAEWGINPGDRVALLGPSSPDWVIAYFGTLRSNAIAVPIDKELKQGELRHILADCGARVLFTAQTFVETITDIIDSLPDLEKIVLLDARETSSKGLTPQAEKALADLVSDWQRLSGKYGVSEEDKNSFENLAENFQSLVMPETAMPTEEKKSFFSKLLQKSMSDAETFDIESISSFKVSNPPPAVKTDPHEPAVILYTSGTTGRSKGAMLSHANIASNVRTAVELFDLDPSMHTLSFLPINHVFEQVAGIILPLSVGGTVSFAESIKKLGDNLREVKPNFLLGVPAVFRLLADRMSKRIDDNKISRMLFSFPPTRKMVTNKVREAFGGNPVFISGGAALDPIVAQKLLDIGLNVYQGYGVTETSPVIAVETPRHNRIGTVGLPLKDVQVKIHEPNVDGIGEIWVKGPNVMLGYYNNQDASNEVLTDGWYHTGDLGYISEDGYLTICGRVKNLIVTANGKNVYPEEVENELSNSIFIAEIMVYGHKIDNVSEEVHAMIYPDQDALDSYAKETGKGSLSMVEVEELIRREVLERCKQLADYKRVKRFTLRDEEFPKTTTRKIKRFAVEADITTGE